MLKKLKLNGSVKTYKNFLEIAGTKLLQRRFSLASETFRNAETQALSNSRAGHP